MSYELSRQGQKRGERRGVSRGSSTAERARPGAERRFEGGPRAGAYGSEKSETAAEDQSRSVSGYRGLIVWQKAMALAAEVYGLTRKLPAEERGALGGGLRHAAVAVPCLVAEGQGRGNGVEFAERLRAARGKLAELDTLLLLGVELGHFRDAEIENATALMTDVRRLLQKFIQRLQGEAQD